MCPVNISYKKYVIYLEVNLINTLIYIDHTMQELKSHFVVNDSEGQSSRIIWMRAQ